MLGLLTGFAWCRGYEALFLRPLERYAGQELPFAAEALAAPQQTTYGQSCEVRLKLGGQSCTAVLYFDEADADIRPYAPYIVIQLYQNSRRFSTMGLQSEDITVIMASAVPGGGPLYSPEGDGRPISACGCIQIRAVSRPSGTAAWR